jgi:O-antigen/teichoic acid export membrane protein
LEEKKSLNRRYLYKIGSNVVAILSGIVVSAIVPRALGVNKYGDFNFTNNIITQILNFLDMRASTCFYVRLSQRREDTKLITFYSIYTLVVFLILLALVSILTIPSYRQLLFENIDSKIIWFSLCLVCIKWVVDILIKIADAQGVTQTVESFKILMYLLGAGVLVVLFYFDVININVFYLYQIASFGLLMFLIFSFFNRKNIGIPLKLSMDTSDFKKYGKEIFTYSLPLAFYLTTTLITEIFDRYILQHYGGSYQQGLYSFSFAMSNMMILFVTAMVPLFTRELSIAFVENDIEYASKLYRKYVPILYVVVAYFCCFLFIAANDVLLIFGGEGYKEAIGSLRILLIYSLVATYSNLNSSVVYAKSENTFLRNLVLVIHPMGMAISYLLISNYFVGAEAIGLAIKVLVIETIGVTVIMFYISKRLELRISKFFIHMIFSPVILLGVAFLAKKLLFYFLGAEDGDIFAFILSGMLYTLLFALIIWFFPIFIGVSRASVLEIISRITKRI